MWAAFARPGFGRLFSGLAASMLGDSIMLLVLSMWVKTLTGSNAMAGLTFLFMVLPAIFAPLLGIVIDRVRRRPLLIIGNLASAAAVLPLVLVRDRGDVWIIWLVAAFYGVSFIVLPAGINGLLKELLTDDLLVDANSVMQTTKEAFRLVGPLIGAALFTWTGGWAVALLDAASFVIAAIAIAGIKVEETVPERSHEPVGREITAGLRHLRDDRVLFHTLIGFGLALLVIGFTEGTLYALLDAFDKPPTYAGLLVATQGVGAVAIGFFAARIVRRLGEVGSVAAGLFVIGVGIAGCALAPSMAVVMVFTGLFGAALPVTIIGFMTMLQRRTPNELMGRASTAVDVVMSVPQAISLALGALLVSFLDYRIMYAIIAIVMTASAAYISLLLRDQLSPASRQVLSPETPTLAQP